MNEQQTELLVIDRDGARGLLDVAGTPEDVRLNDKLRVRLENGTDVFVPANQIVASQAGGYLLSRSFREFGTSQPIAKDTAAAQNTGEQIVFPVIAEELHVETESVVTGGVRVHKRVTERTEVVDQPIQAEEVEVERIPVNRIIDSPPAVRYEGDVIILPLLEEVVVTEKRLMLREEVRIRRRQFETRKPQEVILRSEQVEFEEIAPENLPRDRGANA